MIKIEPLHACIMQDAEPEESLHVDKEQLEHGDILFVASSNANVGAQVSHNGGECGIAQQRCLGLFGW